MKITTYAGHPYPLGVSEGTHGINFAYCPQKYEDKGTQSFECGVVFFDKKGEKELCRVPFPTGYSVGKVLCMQVEGDFDECPYCFYEGEMLVTDTNGRAFADKKVFGNNRRGDLKKAYVAIPEFDWGNDRNPCVPYEESIGYCLHVRGFTAHSSSKVKAKGTFRGVIEKVPYLKELGITTLEFQPVYEFDEVIPEEKGASPYTSLDQPKELLNYWGYVKGYYYSPKAAYSYAQDCCTEFREMIKALHQNGMEAVLQFFFPEETSDAEILNVLTYWRMYYHVDGFHLKGKQLNAAALSEEPVLCGCKLWYHNFAGLVQNSYFDSDRKKDRFVAEYKSDFRYDMRRFLKGDEGMVPAVMFHSKNNPGHMGVVNFLSNYDGFTLWDMVSYDRKHNEDNGEENRDGEEFNCSWNCGIEGPTKKRSVLNLRKKQFRNAVMLLFLSQGMPLLFMGDEFCNSQNGNNNPYGQDNEVTWLNWKKLTSFKDENEFVKNVIVLRMQHRSFHSAKEYRMMDYASCGYPDLSFHCEVPWKQNTAVYSRQLGLFYCGMYAVIKKLSESGRLIEERDDDFYIAMNMHWEPAKFALPAPTEMREWKAILCSDEGVEPVAEEAGQAITLPARSICVLTGEKAAPVTVTKKTKTKPGAEKGN